jgi:predicted amidohydrolase
MSTIKVAALQMRSSTDIGRNVDDFETLVRKAAAAGAVYVQSPEMTGCLVRDRAALKAQRDSAVARVSYDGRSVEYRGTAEIARAIAELER